MEAFVQTTRLTEDDGASAVEYGILLAGVAAVIIIAIFALGAVTDGQFTNYQQCYEQGAAC